MNNYTASFLVTSAGVLVSADDIAGGDAAYGTGASDPTTSDIASARARFRKTQHLATGDTGLISVA